MENKYFKIRTNIYGDTIYYYHYVDGFAHRQLGVTRTEIYMMTDESEIADGILSDSDFEPDDSITAEEFEEAWNSRLKMQKRLFGNSSSLLNDSNAEEKFVRISFEIFGKFTVCFYHFVGDYAVRIIEFTETEILMMKDKYSTKFKLTDNFLSKEVTDSSLKITDALFSDVEILPESFITAEEFEAA